MTKENKMLNQDFQPKDKLQAWADLYVGAINEQENTVVLEGFANQVLNVGDLTSLIDYIIKFNTAQNNLMLEKLSQDIETIFELIEDEVPVPTTTITEYRHKADIRLYENRLIEDRVKELSGEVYKEVEEGKLKGDDYFNRIKEVYDQAAKDVAPKVEDYAKRLENAAKQHQKEAKE